MNYLDQLNLAKCAQGRFRETLLNACDPNISNAAVIERAWREGQTVHMWTNMAAQMFSIYRNI
jgi:hypothetical protein